VSDGDIPKQPAQVVGKHSIIGRECELDESVRIWNLSMVGDHVKMGRDVSIGSMVHISDHVEIGACTLVQGLSFIGRYAKIGENCFIGPGVTLTDDPYPPVRRSTGIAAWAGVTLEDGVIIGANAVIRAGITIGARSVVAMGAVVTKNIPPDVVVIGAPARVRFSRAEYDKKQLHWAQLTGERSDLKALTDEAAARLRLAALKDLVSPR
jgi:acetyltransferase-like isoleucine patch superfamily enzyme